MLGFEIDKPIRVHGPGSLATFGYRGNRLLGLLYSFRRPVPSQSLNNPVWIGVAYLSRLLLVKRTLMPMELETMGLTSSSTKSGLFDGSSNFATEPAIRPVPRIWHSGRYSFDTEIYAR